MAAVQKAGVQVCSQQAGISILALAHVGPPADSALGTHWALIERFLWLQAAATHVGRCTATCWTALGS